jgi:hypothetical protein
MNKKEKIIYCAGIVDGEGYVGIKKSKYARHCPSPTYHERIQIRMVEEGAISFFKELFGGNYYKEKPHTGKGRMLYCYQASDLIAYRICKTLLPFLIIKKKNAELIIQLRKSKDTITKKERGGVNRFMAKPVVDYRESLYLQCKRNNKGGDLIGMDK